MPNDVFLPFVIEQLKEGHTATLPLRGRSMRPFLEDGRDKALLQLCDHPQVGDAVLAETEEKKTNNYKAGQNLKYKCD